MSRRMLLCELGVLELVDRLLVLENENEQLRREIAGAFCGHVHEGRSCQLVRGHRGDHAWAQPDTDQVLRWSA